MASSVADSATDLGRRLVNRAETVVGDDAREAVKRAKHVAREVRGDLTGDYGSSRKRKKPDPRKYYNRSSGR